MVVDIVDAIVNYGFVIVVRVNAIVIFGVTVENMLFEILLMILLVL